MAFRAPADSVEKRASRLLLCAGLAISAGCYDVDGLYPVDAPAAPQRVRFELHPHPLGQSPTSLVARDWDGDRKLDLAVTWDDPTTRLVLLHGLGNGEFSPIDTQTFAFYGRGRAAAEDFDLDGYQDLVLTDRPAVDQGSLVFQRGQDGKATGKYFAVPERTAAVSTPLAPVIAHINGDAFPDVLVASEVDSRLLTFLGDSHTVAPAAVSFGLDVLPIALAAGDLDQAGKDDLAVVDTNGRLQLFAGRGNGQYVNLGIHFIVNKPRGAIVLGDFNRDGATDVAVGRAGGVSWFLLRDRGTALFADPGEIDLAPGSDGAAMAAADIDHDGILDLVLLDHDGGTLNLLLGNGAGGFQAPLAYPLPRSEPALAGEPTPFPSALAVADFDGDGRPDIAAGSQRSRGVVVFMNQSPWPREDGK